MQIAGSQLRDALSDASCPKNALGMIAVDISRIVHLDPDGVEYYPQTRYGDILLPSNIVAVQNERQFGEMVRQRIKAFLRLHDRGLKRTFSPRVSGLLLYYNVPAVDMDGAGRPFVVSYPQIGSLSSSTPFERKYFETFHRQMLNYYRSG
jgi:hypothetical protein